MDRYLLAILGSSVDSFYEADEYPQEGDFVHARFMGVSAGGCPFNVAAVVSGKGGDTRALDMLGKDDDSTEFLLNECQRLNINTANIQIKEGVSNGKVVIINTGINRSMFVVDPIRPAYEVDDKIQDLLNNATYIYSLMHMINRSFKDIEPLLSAKRKGAKIILDGSSKYDDPSRIKTLYSLADGLFINKTNYARLAEASDRDPKDIIFDNGGEFVCVTNGPLGSTLYTRDELFFEPSLKDIEVIDSTGAGDAFAGGFIGALLSGQDYKRALRTANANGAYACTVFGGLGGVCTMAELEKFAKEHDYEL